METIKAPCKDCADRIVGCHSTCEKYIIFAKNREEYRNLVSEKRTKEAVLNKTAERRISLMKKGKWS